MIKEETHIIAPGAVMTFDLSHSLWDHPLYLASERYIGTTLTRTPTLILAVRTHMLHISSHTERRTNVLVQQQDLMGWISLRDDDLVRNNVEIAT